MQKKSDDFSLQEAMRLANTPTGQQLLSVLRQQNPEQLQQIVQQATSGNFQQAQNNLQALLQDPKTISLLNRLKEENHG